ncbi:hypothetical protein FVA74_06725 [Salinibacterium sp. dk2585]|uniref:hypothetical protein n=1 Tax=unclassified Salinibacterium TaxID=2632331 RepID=UPI0011C242E3|nr:MULTISPECIES: hypothetical protein [unclassified Salinibacterium]QEE61305.1 hypothetical protein FVA74_06725 [Salinibacterium sp. dk2585]TXK53981.1 hypothetical protein FVP63_08175 [Salinibacterium sp. dk5596]
MVIGHLSLLLVMGFAVMAALIEALRGRAGRSSAVWSAVAWYLFCFVPLVLLEEDIIELPAITADDFGGAAPLHLSAGVFLWLMTRSSQVRRTEGDRVLESPIPRPLVLTVALIVAWAAWLVALEGELSSFTGPLVLNCVTAGVLGAVTAGALSLRTREQAAQRMLNGSLAGLAAAAACAASVSLLAAAVIGAVAAYLARLAELRLNGERGAWGSALRAAGVGALLGLLAIGVVDDRAGFFFTGQPTLMLGQVAAVLATLVLSIAVAACVRGVLALGHARRAAGSRG